jgi:hypothetical protein
MTSRDYQRLKLWIRDNAVWLIGVVTLLFAIGVGLWLVG